jgi:raffinose/stachyose/melibiose transport system permease protein
VRGSAKWIFLFILPSLILFSMVYVGSVVLMTGSAFTDWRLMSNASFVGLRNFVRMFSADAAFAKAFVNSCIWVFLQSTVHVAIGVVLALILAQREFYWKFIRTIYMIPNIISSAALGMLYAFIFKPRFGLVDSLIALALRLPAYDHNWFYDYRTAFFTVSLTWVPFAAVVTILALSELSSIPASVLESARIDGAKTWQINVHILIPMMRNMIGTCVIVAATSMLKNFDTIYITTNGGPGNETVNLPLYIYKTAMLENNYGYANAIGVVVTLLGIAIIISVSRMFRIGVSDA